MEKTEPRRKPSEATKYRVQKFIDLVYQKCSDGKPVKLTTAARKKNVSPTWGNAMIDEGVITEKEFLGRPKGSTYTWNKEISPTDVFELVRPAQYRLNGHGPKTPKRVPVLNKIPLNGTVKIQQPPLPFPTVEDKIAALDEKLTAIKEQLSNINDRAFRTFTMTLYLYNQFKTPEHVQ